MYDAGRSDDACTGIENSERTFILFRLKMVELVN